MNTQSVKTEAANGQAKRPGKTPKPKAIPQSQPAFSTRPSANDAHHDRPQGPARKDTEANSGAAGKSIREIVFQLDHKSAAEVLLAGCFTNWDEAPIQMRRAGAGSWQTKVLLPAGRYHYKFLVDGIWQDDPRAQERCPNPFGTSNSVLEIS